MWFNVNIRQCLVRCFNLKFTGGLIQILAPPWDCSMSALMDPLNTQNIRNERLIPTPSGI